MQVTVRGRLFPTPSQARVLDGLMRQQSACTRYDYNRICEGMTKAEVEADLKEKFPGLNSRYHRGAYMRAKANYDAVREQVKSGGLASPEKVVFGGRKVLQERERGKLTQKEWRNLRSNQLFSRGDKSKGGNLNLRLLLKEKQLHLRVNTGPRGWIYVLAYIASHIPRFVAGKTAYGVRVLRRGNHFELRIGYEELHPVPTIEFRRGAVGLDTNHDTIDLAVTNTQGQLKATHTIDCHSLTCAGEGKRAWLIGNLAKKVVQFAKYWERGLVLERLEDVARGKPNQHKFTHRKFLEAVMRRAEREGVAVRQVNPAYTSVIGRWKYAPYYNITVHQAAALVVARRGQGFRERLRRLKTLVLELMKGGQPSEGVPSRRVHSWSLWKKLKNRGRQGSLPSRKGTGHKHPDQSPETTGVESQGTRSPTRSGVCVAPGGKTAIPGSGPPPPRAA